MKVIVCLIFVTLMCVSLNALPPQWSEFQRELGIQAAAMRSAPETMSQSGRDTRNYNVGDTKVFWRWNLSVMPPTWNQTTATCRAVGEHCYIFVANSDWGSHMTQANVDEALARLEDNTPNNPSQGAIELDVQLFGPIPDELDNDPKLIVFYSALGSFQGTSFDGYFSPYNQVTEAQAQQMNPSGHSNECEMIYMTCYPLNPVAPVRLSVLAHELEHLIHWGQDANEEIWLNEGCAELAMVAYGVPDPITGFPSAPDNNLTAWNQTFADYVKVMLFFTYLQEHYDDTGLLSSLVADPGNGMASLQTQLAQHFPLLSGGELIRNWTIANYLDSIIPEGDLFNYEQLDLPNFSTISVNQNPTQHNLSVQGYAADYLNYVIPQEHTSFFVAASSPIHVSALQFDAQNLCIGMQQLFGTEFSWETLPAEAARMVFVITNPNSSGVSYDYIAAPVELEDETVSALPTSLEAWPNPFSPAKGSLKLRSDNLNRQGTLSIYNLKGQQVRRLELQAGTQQLQWDGKDGLGRAAESGIYSIVLRSGDLTVSKRITLIN